MRSTGVTNIPRIKRNFQMSPEFSYILETFPDDVLHIICLHWPVYRREINASIRQIISRLSVKCQAGETEIRLPLNNSYVPEPTLTQRSSELCTGNRGLPFLILEPDSPRTYDAAQWGFLREFGVGVSEDLNFYLWVGGRPEFRLGATTAIGKRYLRRISELTGYDASKRTSVK